MFVEQPLASPVSAKKMTTRLLVTEREVRACTATSDGQILKSTTFILRFDLRALKKIESVCVFCITQYLYYPISHVIQAKLKIYIFFH